MPRRGRLSCCKPAAEGRRGGFWLIRRNNLRIHALARFVDTLLRLCLPAFEQE